MAIHEDIVFTPDGSRTFDTMWVRQPPREDVIFEPVTPPSVIFGHEKTTEIKRSGLVSVRLLTAGLGIDPRSLITKCTLQLFSAAVDTGVFDVDIAIPGRDGHWDNLVSAPVNPGFGAQHDIDVRLTDGSGDFIDTGGVTLIHQWALIKGITAPTFGQAVTGPSSPAHGVITAATIKLKKFGAPTGTITVEIYRCVADDGSDDRPTGAVLDTSADVAISSLPSTINDVTFTFASGPAMNDDRRYVLKLVPVYSPGPNGIDYVSAFGTASDGYSGGSTVSFSGLAETWDPGNYIGHFDVPHLYDQDGVVLAGTTISPTGKPSPDDVWRAPHGPIITLPATPHAVDNTWYDYPGLEPLLQHWVNDAAYVFKERVGMILAVREGPFDDLEREADNVRLVVSWIEPDANDEHPSHTVVI